MDPNQVEHLLDKSLKLCRGPVTAAAMKFKGSGHESGKNRAKADGSLAELSQTLTDLGSAPIKPSQRQRQLCSELGQALSDLGRLGDLIDLAKRGWALELFPAQRWSDPFDDIAARGTQGYACLDALDAAGVKFLGGEENSEHGTSPLRSAAKRLDKDALSYFLSKMETQKTSPERLRSELGSLAAQALLQKGQSALIAPMIESDPKVWATSLDARGNGALESALEKGLFDLAQVMLEAAPEAVKLVDATRCAFSSKPLKMLALLVKHGADLNWRGRYGATPLHNAMHARSHSKSLAAKLIALGADVRALDDHGATPIGRAMNAWSWIDMQKTLGATAKDLMDSKSLSSTQGVGSLPTLICSLGQARFEEAGKKENQGRGGDERMAEMVMAASADARAHEAQFIEQGMKACADHGLPKCLEAFVGIGAQHGVALRSELLSDAVNGLPMSDFQEAGRMACLEVAARMGVDLNQSYPLKKSLGQEKATSLIEQVLEGVVENSGAGSDYFEPMARKAKLLARLGCDPSGSQGRHMGWSFDPEGIGRAKLNARTRLEFSAIDAMLEAHALRKVVGKADAPPKKFGGLRV